MISNHRSMTFDLKWFVILITNNQFILAVCVLLRGLRSTNFRYNPGMVGKKKIQYKNHTCFRSILVSLNIVTVSVTHERS